MARANSRAASPTAISNTRTGVIDDISQYSLEFRRDDFNSCSINHQYAARACTLKASEHVYRKKDHSGKLGNEQETA